MDAVELRLQEGDVRRVLAREGGLRHDAAVLLVANQPVPPFQRLFQRRKQRHSADGGSGFSLRDLRAIAFAERHSAADGNRLFLEIHIAVDVQVEHFSPAEAGVEHHHRR